jgi:hypothetical protein
MTTSRSTVEPSERMGKHERHDQYSCAEDNHMACFTQIEGSNATDKNVSDSKIKEAPKDIDCRRGEALPWW